jgi:photosystem II stability/assembly factor-like uncharacterized protein
LDASGIITAIHFVDGSLAHLSLTTSTSTIFYVSRNGGESWSRQSEVTGFVTNFKIFPEGVGYHWGMTADFSASLIRKTTDFGATWESSSLNSGSNTSNISASFLNGRQGYISVVVGGITTVRKTVDGGNTYTNQSVSGLTPNSAAELYFTEENTGFLIGYQTVSSSDYEN